MTAMGCPAPQVFLATRHEPGLLPTLVQIAGNR
jgi:hypothetical protein